MVDVIVHLCKEENLSHPLDALQSNVSDLITKVKGQIRHLEPNSRFVLRFFCFSFDCLLIFNNQNR